MSHDNLISKQDYKIINDLCNSLNIDIEQQLQRNLQLFQQQSNLVNADIDFYGRQARLYPAVAKYWQQMQQAASKDNINIFICSSFRDYQYQYNLIKKKLDSGQELDNIISVLAPPGFSEHHTGKAIDIISDEIAQLDQIFETTKAYTWLCKYANDFNFYLSYPKDNPFGIIYEPWHWCCRA